MVLRPIAVVITCEHGGNTVPAAYRHLFADAGDVLNSHRGWDPGALSAARCFAGSLGAPLFYSQVTRLLVELNRSATHPQLFSEYSRTLDTHERQRLLARHWHPYRNDVESAIRTAIASGHRVMHFSMHTFTPVFNGTARSTDIGLLYDPRRLTEREACANWRQHIRRRHPQLTVHRNMPYRGIADGFVTHLRRQFADEVYAGIELEVSQRLAQDSASSWKRLCIQLAESANELLDPGRTAPVSRNRK